MISRSRYLLCNPVLKRKTFSLLKNLTTLTPNRIKNPVFISKEWHETERFRDMFAANGKREFVPRDQVFP